MKDLVIWILIIVGILIILYWYIKRVKKLKISNVYFITGAVKVGKSFVAVALAVKTYKRNLLRFRLGYPLLRLKLRIRKEKYDEKVYKPMLYSNIPLRGVKYNPFTKDILLRKVRIPNKSVVLLDEISLVADSMLFKDKEINAELMLFFKLFGHYSHGGTLITDSQTIADSHFSLKRSIGRYLYVYNRTNFLLFTRIKGEEKIYCDDASTLNINVGDLEDSQKILAFRNKYYKYYDCYCYSIFTDDLPIQVDYNRPILTKRNSLKCDNLVTLQDFGPYLDKRKKRKVKKLV